MVTAFPAHPRSGFCVYLSAERTLSTGRRSEPGNSLWSATPCGEIRLKAAIPFYILSMRNEFTAVIERDNEWFVAWSPEIPGANGQGRTVEECRESLGAAIQLILEDRREDGLRDAPADALRETVTIQ
jgi:predicted RNase H-like HicB family nuclease